MTDSATRYPCPICRTPAALTSGCPGCGRPADRLAAEVVRLNGELDRLSGQVERARETYLGLFATWRDTRRRRDELAARVRTAAFMAGENAGALATVLAGAGWRRQAPVLLGGAALSVVALRQVVDVWDLLPRWIFLAVGGLILIGLAASYERRRRDLGRLRAVLARMT